MTADLTPVQQLQSEMGVEFYEWDGWPWPSNFGNPVEEYLAPRNSVGIVENSGLRKWELRGPDALRAADYIVAQDCSDMPVGRVHYTPVCNEEGMALDDITVFHLGPERVMLVSGLLSSEDHFRAASAGFDVELVPMSDERGGVQIQGPRSRDVVGRVTDADLAGLPYFHCVETVVAGEECILSRTGYSGELGYEIFASPAAVANVWTALLEAGADDGIRPYGLEAADYLRVESALIFVTFDYQPGELTPYELGLGWAVKLDKGDYIGKACASTARRRAVAPEHHRHRLRGRCRARSRVSGRARGRARRRGHRRSPQCRSRPCDRPRGARRQGVGKHRSSRAGRRRRGRGRVASVLRPGACAAARIGVSAVPHGLSVRAGMRLASGPTRARRRSRSPRWGRRSVSHENAAQRR